MGANPSTKLQVNFSTPSRTLINVYADDEIELKQLLDGIGDAADAIAQAEQLLGAVSAVKGQLGGQVVQDSTGPAYGSQQAAQGSGEFCAHGEMIVKSGISKAGNNYTVYECPVKQCDSKWPPRKRG